MWERAERSFVTPRVASSRGRASSAPDEVIHESVEETGKSFLRAEIAPDVADAALLEEVADEDLTEELVLWVLEVAWVDEVEVFSVVVVLATAVGVATRVALVAEEGATEAVGREEVTERVLHVDRLWRLWWGWKGAAETDARERARMAMRVLNACMAG